MCAVIDFKHYFVKIAFFKVFLHFYCTTIDDCKSKSVLFVLHCNDVDSKARNSFQNCTVNE